MVDNTHIFRLSAGGVRVVGVEAVCACACMYYQYSPAAYQAAECSSMSAGQCAAAYKAAHCPAAYQAVHCAAACRAVECSSVEGNAVAHQGYIHRGESDKAVRCPR